MTDTALPYPGVRLTQSGPTVRSAPAADAMPAAEVPSGVEIPGRHALFSENADAEPGTREALFWAFAKLFGC